MTKQKQNQTNNSSDADTETESRNSNNSKLGHPQTGVWKFFKRDQPKGDGHWEGTYRLEELAKIYRFNLSNPIEQLRHTQTADITPEIMSNIAETVFKEFEEETLTDNDEIEMLNSAEDLYPNEQNLDLSISTSIDFKSSVFT
ncbi:7530_t:CDS:2, partial [Racocetra fulgida]